MLEKFKNLTKGKKIAVGIIGFLLLPITILLLAVELLVSGFKTKKVGKIILGGFLAVCIVYGLATFDTTDTSTDSASGDSIETSNETTKPEEDIEETPTMTSEELISKLETYEAIYSVIPAGIQEASQTNNTLEMQKSFATGRDVLEKGWQELGDLRKSYNTESDEYRAIENLHMAFYTLRDACKNGIKYLDKNEYKYFEKYEDDCASAGAWLNDYFVYKDKLK